MTPRDYISSTRTATTYQFNSAQGANVVSRLHFVIVVREERFSTPKFPHHRRHPGRMLHHGRREGGVRRVRGASTTTIKLEKARHQEMCFSNSDFVLVKSRVRYRQMIWPETRLASPSIYPSPNLVCVTNFTLCKCATQLPEEKARVVSSVDGVLINMVPTKLRYYK